MDQSWITAIDRTTSRAFIAKCTALLGGLTAICLVLVLVLAHPYALFFGMIEHHPVHHPNLIDVGIMMIIAAGIMMVIFPVIDIALAGIAAAYSAERRMLREKLEPFR